MTIVQYFGKHHSPRDGKPEFLCQSLQLFLRFGMERDSRLAAFLFVAPLGSTGQFGAVETGQWLELADF